MGYETIIYEKENGVAKIILNRPQALNAFTPQMNGELQEIAGRSADYDEGVRAFLEKRPPVFTGK